MRYPASARGPARAPAQIAATAPAVMASMTAAMSAITTQDGQLSARTLDQSAKPLQPAS